MKILLKNYITKPFKFLILFRPNDSIFKFSIIIKNKRVICLLTYFNQHSQSDFCSENYVFCGDNIINFALAINMKLPNESKNAIDHEALNILRGSP